MNLNERKNVNPLYLDILAILIELDYELFRNFCPHRNGIDFRKIMNPIE